LIIHRTLNDTARRKRDVIVSGLPESNTYDDHMSLKLPKVPRRLLVRLGSEDKAEAVSRDERKLRLAPDTSNVFINPDLSPAAATLAYEAWKKRRESKLKRPRPNSRIMETAHDGEDVNDDHRNRVVC